MVQKSLKTPLRNIKMAPKPIIISSSCLRDRLSYTLARDTLDVDTLARFFVSFGGPKGEKIPKSEPKGKISKK